MTNTAASDTVLGDRYRIERELGRGGMAVVYLAHDVKHDRNVAIKLLNQDLATWLGPERFLREIQIVAKLQHPNILGLIDSGESDGRLYYVMPFVPGESLRARLERDGEFPVEEGMRIMRELADALAFAHHLGIVHRDIKPENVLFSGRHVQLADFGIAKAVNAAAAGSTLTGTGIAVGSPTYMAPEQAAGDLHVDHRADIYALGVLAYELFTGTPPFAAPTAQRLIAAHMTEAPAPLLRRRPTVPAALDQLVMRCLEKRPADRWQSAEELVRSLDALLRSDTGIVTHAREHAVSMRVFKLTESVCRRLDRASYDPRFIDDTMEVLDNNAPSDVLVCLLHAFGLDGSEFDVHLRSLPYHCIAPTLLGFEQSRRRRFSLSLADHVMLIREVMRDTIERTHPALVIVAGFSSGADFALRLVPAPSQEAQLPIDGVLSLGCNLSLETAFVTRVVARLGSSDDAQVLRDLRTVGDSIQSLDEWLTVHGYLVEMLGKFQQHIEPLRALGQEIIRPFDGATESAFIGWYRDVSKRVRALRCVFEDTDTCNRLIREIQLQNHDTGVLGEHYREGSIVIDPETNHFDLVKPDRIAHHLDALVGQIRAEASR